MSTRRAVLATSLGVIALAALLLLLLAYLGAPPATRVKAGEMAPDLVLPSLGPDGAVPTRLSTMRGEPMLLVFFVPGTPESDEQMPGLERLNRQYLLKGLRVIGVAVHAGKAAAQGVADRVPLTFIILRDPAGEAVLAAYGAREFPQSYLIDAAGRVASVYTGRTDWTSADVHKRIEKLLPPPRRP